MSEIILGEEQVQALDAIKSFITNSTDTCFSLCGSAGTGKSLLISYIIDFAEKKGYDYVLCAPTHKAATVIKNYTKREALTLHKLLALAPKLDIFKLDLRELEFVSGKSTANIPFKGLVICDEASMVSDDLFSLLIKRCHDLDTKILFVSDKAQLNPVKSADHSKVYTVKNKVELTKIYRQSSENALMPYLKELRSKAMHVAPGVQEALEGSIYQYNSLKDILFKVCEAYKQGMIDVDIFRTKVLAYTNQRVESYNKAIKNLLFGKDEEYYVGELLMAYKNGEYQNFEFFNSMEYYINKVEPVTKYIDDIKLHGYNLSLYDTYSKSLNTVFILSEKKNDTQALQSLAQSVELTRLDAIYCKKKETRNKLWGKYYGLLKKFVSPIDLYYDGRVVIAKAFDSGYACTVHKSQGSSYQEIFVDWGNILKAKDEVIKRQLQYVALSRTRSNAHLLVC